MRRELNVVRLFNVYYPLRSFLLLIGEAIIVCGSFVVASRIEFGAESYSVLNFEDGYYKILAATGFAIVWSHYFDLYNPDGLVEFSAIYFRLSVVLVSLAVVLSVLGYLLPGFIVRKLA